MCFHIRFQMALLEVAVGLAKKPSVPPWKVWKVEERIIAFSERQKGKRKRKIISWKNMETIHIPNVPNKSSLQRSFPHTHTHKKTWFPKNHRRGLQHKGWNLWKQIPGLFSRNLFPLQEREYFLGKGNGAEESEISKMGLDKVMIISSIRVFLLQCISPSFLSFTWKQLYLKLFQPATVQDMYTVFL